MKNRIITYLKEKKGYVSGQKIADELHITRNAVHKHIKSLKALGYTIKSKRALGYKLVDDLNFINSSLLEKKFKGHVLGGRIIHLKSVDSTNNEAYRRAERGCGEGTIVLSESQTKGKGRMGRSWESSMSANLYFSVVLRPKIPPSTAPRITVISAFAVAEAIEESVSIKPNIKWPNDVLINGKKVCGILTEMKSESDMIDFMVLGIGVNVNSTQKEYPKKLLDTLTTLKEETRKTVSRQALFEKIILNLEKWYTKVLKGSNADKIKDEWSRYCYLTGKIITVKNIHEETTGTVLGIDREGFLILKAAGKMKKISSGTIVKVS
jgi:BirA family biotin operon repressor/biotin-[acetyl-CoA-carboxylase] ligase